MKKTKLFSLLLLLALVIGSSIAFIACDDDDDSKPEDKYIGTYMLLSAEQADADTIDLIIAIPTVTDSMVHHYIPGADLTSYVQNALFNNSPCENSLDTRIELRSNMEAWFICDGDTGELQMGTWFLNDAGDQMTITYPAISFNVVITDLSLVGTALSGTIGFPFPIDARYPLGSVLPYPIGANPAPVNFQTPKAVAVVFTKS